MDEETYVNETTGTDVTVDAETELPEGVDVDVLVVGAGPAGMPLAVALQRQGVRCRISFLDVVDVTLHRAHDAPRRTHRAVLAHLRPLHSL